MKNEPYKVQHLKKAQKKLDAHARYVQELLEREQRARKEKKGLLARLMEWFS